VNEHDVHTDPGAITELTDAAAHQHTEVAPDGSAIGYKARRTLGIGVELRRQIRRRRSQLVLGFLVLLPFILALSFEIGSSDPNRRSGGFVDLATASGINFVVLTLFVSGSFLLPMIVALFFGDTIASEASWSSLKYLLAAPIPRHRLLRQKALSSGILSFFALALLPAVALGVGVLWYGAGEVVSPTGEAAPFADGVLGMGLAVCYIAINLFWVAGLALFLSVSTDAPLGAVGGAVFLSIITGVLDAVTALGDLREWLPAHWQYAWADALQPHLEWGGMIQGVSLSVSYAIVLLALAFRGFARKDVVS